MCVSHTTMPGTSGIDASLAREWGAFAHDID